MYILICNVAYYVMIPILLLYFFCRYCDIPFHYKHCFYYVLCSILLFQIEIYCNNYFYFMIFEILLLSVYGSIILKGMFFKTFVIATLIYTIYSICNGLTQFVSFWVLSHYTSIYLLQYGNSIQIAMTLLLTYCFLLFLSKYKIIKIITVNQFYIFTIFFICIVERIISNHIYGNTIVWNDKIGITFPIVNHTTILLLQIFSIVCLVILFMAYQNMTKSICAEHTIQMLKQQYHFQKIYMQQAQTRYEQTRSFRHDIKNHFMILSELLKEKQFQKAYQYFYDLEEISQNLCFDVQTGNVVINALLNYKFSIAKQKNIIIDCDFKVIDNIQEIDWCIILCNALDNAIIESDNIEKKYIYIKGQKKGNIYMLSIKNRCRDEIIKVPEWGIGLHNINAVCQKYSGTMTTEVKNGIYSITMFFIIPQQ